MLRRIAVVALVGILSGCSSARTACDKVEGRLKSGVEFCKTIAQEAAEARCSGMDPKQVDQCLDLIGQGAFSECISRTGAERLAWFMQEFCQ